MSRKSVGTLWVCLAVIIASSSPAHAQRADIPVPSGGPIAVTAVTPSGNGVLMLPGVDGAAGFAVTTVNKGDSRTITIKAETGKYALPVDLTVCRTNSSGKCVAKAAGVLARYIAHGATMTFKVNARGTNNLPRLGIDRAYLDFYDDHGTKVGGTSVALDDGSKLPAGKNLAGIYTVDFQTPAHPAYNLGGEGLMIATSTGDGFIVTQSGIVIHQGFGIPRAFNFSTDLGWFYPFANAALKNGNYVDAVFSLTGVDVPRHWTTSQYQLTAGRVVGFEYGVMFATYQQALSERGSSLARIQGSWKIRVREGGPVVGTITFDASGIITAATFRECNTSPGDYTPLDGTITPVDTRFNAYTFQFKNGGILTDDPLCDDLASASGVAATFDTTAPNDTVRILMNGQLNGYSWILTRH